MNKMASDIVDRWLITASALDDDYDMDVLGARIPNKSNTKRVKGKKSMGNYGNRGGGVNKKRYKWTQAIVKGKCWYKRRPKLLKEYYAKWKELPSEDRRNYKNFNEFFKEETVAEREESLCYHKDDDGPGRHPDLEGAPETKLSKDPKANNKYQKFYWSKRLKEKKTKTASEALIENVVNRYES